MEHQHKKIELCETLLPHILQKNYFQFNDKIYRSGTVNSNTVNSKEVSFKSLQNSYHFMFKMHC